MKLFYILILMILISMSGMSYNNNSKTLSLLTDDSVKYWRYMNEERGIAFYKKNNEYIEYDDDHYIVITNQLDYVYQKKFKIRNDIITLFYYGKKRRNFIDSFTITKISKDTLILNFSNSNEKLYLINDKIFPLTDDPVLFQGFIWPIRKFNMKQIDSLVTEVIKKMPLKEAVPDTLSLKYVTKIDSCGFITKLYRADPEEIDPKYNYFYLKLEEALKKLTFIPAMNKTLNRRYKSRYLMRVEFGKNNIIKRL